MSSTPKFNAKNLHYEKQEPAFLRRLRGEAVGAGGGDSDRLNVQHARPGKKPRLEMGDDDEDGPTVVYEGEAGAPDGGNVGREEYEALMKAKKADGGKDLGKQDGEGDALRSGVGAGEEREKQKVADVGGAKKRKVGKVVGGEDDHVVAVEQGESRAGLDARHASATATTATATKSKPSKKQKKVKLSFDEPDS
jgi:hypothetical protein